MLLITDRLISAPAGDKILKESDLCELVEALLEAKNKASDFGLKLLLPSHEIDSICSIHRDPQEQLTSILKYFLKRVEPRPTWGMIINALKSSMVDLPRLAETIEADHFPNPTATSGKS